MWNYRAKAGARRLQEWNKTTLKGTVYVILELRLRRSKGTMMKSTSLHLKTPDNYPEALIDLHK